MIDVSQLLPKLVIASCGNEELLETAVKLAWIRVAGDGLRRQVAPFRLYRKTLIVAVPDAIWQKQLHRMSSEFTRRINQLLDSNVIVSIEFRIDPETIGRTVRRATSHHQEVRTRQVPTGIADAARTINDLELRQLFERAAANCLTRRDPRRIEP